MGKFTFEDKLNAVGAYLKGKELYIIEIEIL